MNASGITIVEGGWELLDQIEALWHELRAHHARLSPIWSQWLLAGTFEQRKAALRAKSARGMLVLLAKVNHTLMGYCVCTIDRDGAGEVDSIFVVEAQRGKGLGRKLVERAMAWLEQHCSGEIVVGVMSGNEPALRLYERFGFRARVVKMRYVAQRGPHAETR